MLLKGDKGIVVWLNDSAGWRIADNPTNLTIDRQHWANVSLMPAQQFKSPDT